MALRVESPRDPWEALTGPGSGMMLSLGHVAMKAKETKESQKVAPEELPQTGWLQAFTTSLSMVRALTGHSCFLRQLC